MSDIDSEKGPSEHAREVTATMSLQVKDLEILQRVAGNRELLYQHTLGTELWKGWKSSPPCNVISTRSIILNELVFDLDSENWKAIYEEGTKLVRYLRAKHIPFVLGHSGGKGVHVHVLIDPTSYQFSEEVSEQLVEYGVDVWNEVRSFLAGYLAGEAGLNQERAKLDWRKVKWSSGKKGSLVRTWGCPRPDGGYKTLIEDIPPQRPEPASLPLMFPSSYGLWNISKLSANLDGLFRSKLRACKDSTIREADVSSSELDEYPCYAGLRKGLPEGLRNEGAFILSAFNRMKGVPLEQAETVLADYSRASAGYSPSVEGEHLQTLRSVYGSEYRHPCCRKVRDVNDALCDRRTCPLYAPKPVEPMAEGVERPHPFTFGYQSALRAGLISPDERTVDVQLTAEYILEHQAFVNLQEGSNVSLWYYEDGVYLPLGEDKAARLCEELLMKKACTRTVNEIVNKIRRMLEPRRADDGNAEGWVCVENGYLNVFERTLEPQHPGRVFLTRMPVEYNSSAECPRILAFLRAITDLKTDPDALLEVIGYCLMPHHKFHWMPILLGEGENGKGTLLALITALLGRDNVSSATLHDLGENKFAKADLYGKMANICGDLDAADLKVTGPLKGLTGGDQIRAERKGQHPFTFVNRAKIIASCNRIPYTKDDTRGFTRRPRVFLFPNTFSGDQKDPDILDKMTGPEELSGLLNEALAGLGRLVDSRGALTGRENEDAEIERYVTMQDSASRFLNLFCMEDKLRFDENGRALQSEKQGKKDLYETYVKWCKASGFAVQSDKVFSRSVRTIFPNVVERKWGADCIDSPNSRCWVGLIYDE